MNQVQYKTLKLKHGEHLCQEALIHTQMVLDHCNLTYVLNDVLLQM